MLKPSGTPPAGIYTTNFYNVATGTSSITSASQLLPADFNENYTFQCSKYVSDGFQAVAFRTDYQRMCTIRYDRYRRDAKVNKHFADGA
jgi:hypothetical protein